jgi:hypothetical protein
VLRILYDVLSTSRSFFVRGLSGPTPAEHAISRVDEAGPLPSRSITDVPTGSLEGLSGTDVGANNRAEFGRSRH